MTQEYYMRSIDIIQTQLEYEYQVLGQGTLRQLGYGLILSFNDYRPYTVNS